MRVCYFGAYDPEYPRNEILRAGLAPAGVEVVECRAAPELPMRARMEALARRFRRIRHEIDAVVVAEFNHPLVPLAVALAAPVGVPVVTDFLTSVYDTAVEDRLAAAPGSPQAAVWWLTDVAALRLSDAVIADTAAHADYFALRFRAVRDRVEVISVGAAEWRFPPTPPPRPPGDGQLRVLFYGNYIPLHGVEHILDAARELEDDPRFRFTLLGRGQTSGEMRARYESRPTRNVEFVESASQADLRAGLADRIQAADVCLGIFGASPKADRAVPNKVWQCLSANRLVVTGDSAAAREVLTHGRDCVLVPHADARALAAALRDLAGDPGRRTAIAAAGARLTAERYTSRPLGRDLARMLDRVVERSASPAARARRLGGATGVVAREGVTQAGRVIRDRRGGSAG